MVSEIFDFVFSVLYNSLRDKLGTNLEKNIQYARICFLCFIVRFVIICLCLRDLLAGTCVITAVVSQVFGFIFVFQDKSSINPFPVPLAIVGGKYDIYQVSSGLTSEKVET